MPLKSFQTETTLENYTAILLQEEKIPPKPYVYEYGGVDYNGQAFAKTESQDEYGAVNGKYDFLSATSLLEALQVESLKELKELKAEEEVTLLK